MDAKYPLPAVPPSIKLQFNRLCEELDQRNVSELRERVTRSVEMLLALDKRFHTGLGDSIYLLAQRCDSLLQRYDTFQARERAMIVGAVRYFVLQRDGLPDDTPFLGLEDDIQVLNHVLEAVGLSSEAICISTETIT